MTRPLSGNELRKGKPAPGELEHMVVATKLGPGTARAKKVPSKKTATSSSLTQRQPKKKKR
jgi:hypothetical protein